MLYRRARCLAVAALLALSCVGVAGRGRADNAGDAVKLYDQSSEAYRSGHFREAVTLLERAYALHPEPVLLYNIGRADEGLGDYVHALAAYERYLKEESDIPDRPAIERRIATLRLQIAQTAERERLEAERDRDARSQKALPWIVVGVGGAGLTAAAVFGLLAHGKETDAHRDPIQQAAANDGKDAQRLATIANVALIAGGALAIGGLTWVLVRAGSARPTASLRIAPRISGVSLALEL